MADLKVLKARRCFLGGRPPEFSGGQVKSEQTRDKYSWIFLGTITDYEAFGTSFAACRTKDSLCQASHTREV